MPKDVKYQRNDKRGAADIEIHRAVDDTWLIEAVKKIKRVRSAVTDGVIT
jgi:hypothetical protein